MADEFSSKPYAQWLEDTVREMVDIDPVCVSMQMIDAEGKVYTCYWNCDRNDRAIMLDAMKDDDLIDLIRNNRELILDILNEEDDDGLCEADTEADSEG